MGGNVESTYESDVFEPDSSIITITELAARKFQSGIIELLIDRYRSHGNMYVIFNYLCIRYVSHTSNFHFVLDEYL